MIVLDRLVHRDAAPAAWKTTALAWSVAVMAASVPAAYAQTPSSHTPAVNGAASAVSTPAASSPGETQAMPDHYAVQKGQSLLDVAADLTHSTDKSVKQNLANAMFAANPNAFYGNNPSRLKVGAVLVVPRPGESPASAAAAAANASVGGTTASAPGANAASTSAAVASAASSAAQSSSQAPAQAAPSTQAGKPASSVEASNAASVAMVSMAASTSATAASATTSATSPATANAAASAPANTMAASASEASATLAVEPASSVPNASAASGVAEASGASAAMAASNAQAWTGSIRPAPVAPVAASAAAADAASLTLAPSQSVSSLQQLLQLKNRVLAAMQAHGFGSPASAPLIAGAPRVASGASAASGTHIAAAGDPVERPQGGLRGPLAVPAAFAVLIVVALGIWVCLPARRRKPQSEGDTLDGMAERPDPAPSGEAEAAATNSDTPLDDARASAPAPAPRTANTAKSRLTAAPVPESESESEPEPQETSGKLPPDDDPIFDLSSQNTPFGQPPFSFEEGAAGGLPTHDPQRSPFAETRTPFDTGLLLGLLEMHAHRHEVERFQETAHELWELTDGEGPDWKRASALGRRIDPDNPLYAEDPFSAYRHQHQTSEPAFVKPLPDVDLGLPTSDGEHVGASENPDSASASNTDKGESDNTSSSNAGDALSASDLASANERTSTPRAEDLDWLDAPSAAAHEAFQPHPRTDAAAQEDDVTLPEARRPEHVPVSEHRDAFEFDTPSDDAGSVADDIGRGVAGAGAVAGLGATSDSLFSGDAVRASALRDAQAQSASRAGAPAAAPAHTPIGAAGFGALKLDFDLELSPNAAAPGSTPTSHDLATIARNKLDLAIEYVELGDRAGARTLLNEVLATHDPATHERAQSLLDSLK